MNDDLQHQKYVKLTTKPVGRLIMGLALPSMASMLVSALYNMADTLFIGKISTQATGAVGIVFSYMALIQAIAFFFGQGSGNYISRKLGSRETADADKMAATGFFSAFIFGVLIAVPCFVFADPILRMLGATETILPDARNYFLWLLPATPFIMTSFVMNNQMRFQGNANRSMIGIISGAVLNIILDPILIFGFGLGVTGAAIATAFSQLVGFTVLLVMSGTGGGIKIRLKNFTPSLRMYREIFAGGLPSLGRQGLASVAAILLNNAAKAYGDPAIAAFSIVTRATMIAMSALIGFGQGFQPVCGFNYGAKLYGRVRKGFDFCVIISTVFMIAVGAAFFGFAEQIICMFRADDAELIVIGAKALRFQSVVFPLQGFTIIANMYLQNTRKTAAATITAVSRQGLMFIPALFILSATTGLLGIQLAQPVSDLLTFGLSLPFCLHALRQMSSLPSAEVK